MADSRHNWRYSDWSKIVDDLFDQIAIRLDFIAAVRLATCSKEFYRQVDNGNGNRYPNDGCGEPVAFSEFHGHKITCQHGSCTCMEPGCEFAAPPAGLLAHLREAHSLEVDSFHYGEDVRFISSTMLAPGSTIVHIIGPGDDGMVFAAWFHMCERDITVSVFYIRSAACLSPRYKVNLSVSLQFRGAAWISYSGTFTVVRSSDSSGVAALEDLSSFMPFPRIYLRCRELSESTELEYMVTIDKIHEG